MQLVSWELVDIALDPDNSNWDEFHDPEIVDWKRIRSSIEHENMLTNHRLTWLLTSQGFLIAAFALVFQASAKDDVLPDLRDFYKIVLAVLAFTGILVSAYLHLGLRAAQVQHNRLKEWWENRPLTRHDRHPSICGNEFGYFTDILPYHSFPFLFIVTWLILVSVVLWDNLQPYTSQLSIAALALVIVVALIVILRLVYEAGQRNPKSTQIPEGRKPADINNLMGR